MKPKKLGNYTIKTYQPYIYTWSPETTVVKTPKTGEKIFEKFCTAKPPMYGLGEDYITTYVYDLVVVDGIQKRLAYVECGYVE